MSSLAQLVLHRRRAGATVSARGWAELWARVFDDGTVVGRAHDVEPRMVRMVPSNPTITLIAVGAWPMQYFYRWAAFAVIEDVPFLIPPVRGPEVTTVLDRVRAYDVPVLDDPPWQAELARSYRRAAGVNTVAPRSPPSSLASIDLGPTLLDALADDEAVRVFEWLARMSGVGIGGLAEGAVTPGLDLARTALPELPRAIAGWDAGDGVVACVEHDEPIGGTTGERHELAAVRLVRRPRWSFTRVLLAEHEDEGQALS